MKPYSEQPPAPELRDTVECFWSHESGDVATNHRVLPDGCVDLLVSNSDGRLHAYVIGSMTTFKDVPIPPHTLTAGIRFLPGQASRHLRMPLHPFCDDRVDLEALFGSRAKPWMDAVLSGELRHVWNEMVHLVGPAHEASTIEQAAALAADKTGITLETLQQSVWLSERQFRRSFQEKAGIGPKQFLRVMRMRRALSALRHQPCGRSSRITLAGFAQDFGFYDQAHCANEFRSLTGHSPSHWILQHS